MWPNAKKNIVFLLGVSWSGKTTLMEKLINHKYLQYVQSYTTRPMRDGEKNWDKYRHISKELFIESIETNQFLEYALVHNSNYYWTKIADIESVLAHWNIAIKEIDMYWREKLQNHPMRSNIISIFLQVDDITMTQRIMTRQPDITADELQNRLISADFENNQAKKYCDIFIDASQSPDQIYQEVLWHIQTHTSVDII